MIAAGHLDAETPAACGAGVDGYGAAFNFDGHYLAGPALDYIFKVTF